MARYQVEFSSAAYRQFKGLDRTLQLRIAPAIDALAECPRPSGCVKLSGVDNLYRIRIGAFRVIYAVEDDRLVVLVVKVGPRRDAYRGI